MTTSTHGAGPSARPGETDFSTSSEADLMEWMALGESSPGDARAAFAEFHKRHAKYLLNQATKHYGDQAEDVAQDTLLRVFDRAGTFELARLKACDPPDQHRRVVRAWLGVIARNVAIDMFAAREREPVTHSCTTSLPDDWGRNREHRENLTLDDALIDRVRGVIDSLPERDKRIAWVVAHNWQPGETANRWSKSDLAAVADQLQTTPENVRQLKCRLFKLLRELLAPAMSAGVSDR